LDFGFAILDRRESRQAWLSTQNPKSKIQCGDEARAATGSLGPLELDHISSAGAMALRLPKAMARGTWLDPGICDFGLKKGGGHAPGLIQNPKSEIQN
jgi:hypothetical protein